MAWRRNIPVLVVVALALAGCGKPDDTITEIEHGENGTKVETNDGHEYYLRHGLDCDHGDRLWVCATKRDLLVERK